MVSGIFVEMWSSTPLLILKLITKYISLIFYRIRLNGPEQLLPHAQFSYYKWHLNFSIIQFVLFVPIDVGYFINGIKV